MENMQEILFQQNANGEKGSLTCMVCKNFLSIPPILYNDTIGSICGRENCMELAKAKGKNHRQSAYEVLSKFLLFPCMYRENGCQEKLSWDQVGEHEKICKYANFVCPFACERFEHLEEFKCSWEGDALELSDHLDQVHPAHRFDHYVEFQLENEIEDNRIYFSRIQGSIIIVLVIKENSSFYLKVWSGSGVWRSLNYKTEILTEREEVNALKLRKPDLIQPSFFKSETNNSWLKVNFAYIKDFFDSPSSLIVKFYIDGVVLGPSPKSHIPHKSLLLHDAKCIKCLQELSHPAFVCESIMAHDICSKCLLTPNTQSATPTLGSSAGQQSQLNNVAKFGSYAFQLNNSPKFGGDPFPSISAGSSKDGFKYPESSENHPFANQPTHTSKKGGIFGGEPLKFMPASIDVNSKKKYDFVSPKEVLESVDQPSKMSPFTNQPATSSQQNKLDQRVFFKLSENMSCPECKSAVSRNSAFDQLKYIVNQSLQYCLLCDKNVDGLINHLTYDHTKSIYQLDKCYSDFSLSHYFFLFDKHVFRLTRTFSTLDKKLSFFVQCLGTKELKYKYELQLTNTKYGFSSITFCNFCHPEIQCIPSGISHPITIPHDVWGDIFPNIDSIGFKLSISWLQ